MEKTVTFEPNSRVGKDIFHYKRRSTIPYYDSSTYTQTRFNYTLYAHAKQVSGAKRHPPALYEIQKKLFHPVGAEYKDISIPNSMKKNNSS